jgi:cysteine synthase B
MTSVTTNLADLVGNTPLIKLNRLTRDLPDNVEVLLKAEWFNPGGSVKDRAARGIVLDAFAAGSLKKGGILLDASSGNTGIAYAMLSAVMRFKLVLCLPKNANEERKRTLLAYGAELVLTDPNDGSDGAIKEARRLAEKHPDYYYADQYSNDSNWKAHYNSTGPELVAQTQGKITHFISGLGTTGTCMGVGRYLRENTPNAKIISFEPDSPFHGLEGMKHMETAIVPSIYDTSVAHQNFACQTEKAYKILFQLGKEEGLFVGISAAAATSIALQIAKEEANAGRAATIVALCPDGGNRYLSEHFWNDEH